MNIKEYIQNNLYRKDGKLNSAILRRDKFVSSNEYAEILSLTDFLPVYCTMSERIHCIVNDITVVPICPICKINNCVFLPHAGAGYANTCNVKKCISNHEQNINNSKITRLQKYGEFVSPKHRELFTKNSKKNQKKSAASIKQKYNVDNISQIEGVRKKVEDTNMKLYGSSNWKTSLAGKEHIKNKKIQSFSDCIDVCFALDEYKDIYPNATNLYTFKCSICGNVDTKIPRPTINWRLNNFGTSCSACSQLKFGSVFQNEVYEFVKSLGIACERNAKPLPETKKEIDVYIEEENSYTLGIEVI